MTVGAPPSERLGRVRSFLDTLSLDAILVSRNAGKRWLSGFVIARGDEATSGYSGTLLVTRDRQLLLTDARYLEQAGVEAPGWLLHRTSGALADELPPLLYGVRRLGCEAGYLPHATWSALAGAASGVELVPVDDGLARLRLLKDADEVEALQRAADLTDACFGALLDIIRPGVTEQQIAWQIEGWFRGHGAEDVAFNPIVLVGARAAMPHGRPGRTAVAAAEPLLIDFGCQVDGYRSDMTRTVFIGEPSERQRELYAVVLAAQQAAYDALRPGVTGVEVDAAARRVIEHAGHGDSFTHGLGHGIGLETHEAPFLLRYEEPMRPGMVFTLEPGIYLPGEIGIRIEDEVVLAEDGPRRLTNAPRELLVI
ncbi:MAG TPA: Xaa-Pro peptidase family protein [Candidatus Limnocylindria bacterium]|nr:Xaa-Pro peptidase family protein [Candidatus Limnocylindria bacterium]